jgi:hypothetical protein
MSPHYRHGSARPDHLVRHADERAGSGPDNAENLPLEAPGVVLSDLVTVRP